MSAKCQITDPFWVIKAWGGGKGWADWRRASWISMPASLLESCIQPTPYLLFRTGVILCKTFKWLTALPSLANSQYLTLLFFSVSRVLQQTGDLVLFKLRERERRGGKKISLQTKSSTCGDTSYKDDKPERIGVEWHCTTGNKCTGETPAGELKQHWHKKAPPAPSSSFFNNKAVISLLDLVLSQNHKSSASWDAYWIGNKTENCAIEIIYQRDSGEAEFNLILYVWE